MRKPDEHRRTRLFPLGCLIAATLAVLLVAALAVTLFFGGWLGPWLPGPVWFGLKTGVIAVVFVWLRATLPRPRYDQLLAFAWKIALPLSLLNLMLTGIVVVARSAS